MLPIMFNSQAMNDTFANFGGIIYGTFIGLVVVASHAEGSDRTNWVRWLSGIITIGITGGLVAMFYFVSTPKKYD